MNKTMKKVICGLLATALTLSCAACRGGTGNPNGKPDVPPMSEMSTLSAPFNIQVTEKGLITWVGDVNATQYVVTVDGEEHICNTPYFYLDGNKDVSFTIVARADGYKDSAAATGRYEMPKVELGIISKSEIRPGNKMTLTVKVAHTTNSAVTWSIEEGAEYAQIDEKGVLTAAGDDKITSDRVIVVKAVSKADPTVSARRVITITAKSVLTQAMLDAVAASDKLGFEGYVNVNLYEFGISDKFYRSFTSDVKTAMDGTNWYTEYDNATTGTTQGMYYKNDGGIASQVSVSFMNEESFTPMLDDDLNPVTWTDSGLYNNFKGLTVDNFEFNEETWRWEYKNADGAAVDTTVERIIASANPYEFEPTNLALIITDGEIAGIYSKAKPDPTLVEQYNAVQELVAVINVGEVVDVPTITKFEHADIHDELQTAIDNMRALKNYTVEFLNIGGSQFASGYSISGYTEYITEKNRHFRPFVQDSYGTGETVVRTYTDDDYGYSWRREDLYNMYATEKDGSYSANRAYTDDFANSMPSFAFAPEIFNMYSVDEEEGTTTFYVNSVMSPVASTFYCGVGNDDALFGLFATEGRISQNSTFTPYVTVKDGYIIESCFYYYLGYMYGVIEIDYKDFNMTQMPMYVDEKLATMETREVPDKWEQVQIITTPDSTDTEHMENGLVHLQNFFDDADIAEKLPFFNLALGDTYGFGLTTYKAPPHSSNMVPAIVFYYDVPLDVDYSLESSIKAVKKLLTDNGYTRDKDDVYSKGEIRVQVVDSSLDLNINVWRVKAASQPTPPEETEA